MKKEIKATCTEFNKEYNIISIKKPQNEYKEFYLEKNGYGDLFYIVGVKEQDFELSRNYILQSIAIAESENFWVE